jgi:hypothetical protein
MDATDEDSAPILTIYYLIEEAEELTCHTQPVYPFQASDMPEKVQGMIDVAEQWLINLDCTSF